MKDFPKSIYVTREGEGDDEYYVVHPGVPELNETAECAIYALSEVGEAVVSRRFVSDNPPSA